MCRLHKDIKHDEANCILVVPYGIFTGGHPCRLDRRILLPKRICYLAQTIYTHTSSPTYPYLIIFHSIIPHHHAFSASSSNPCKLMLLGLSIGRPNALSQINCANGPNPLLTPNVAV